MLSNSKTFEYETYTIEFTKKAPFLYQKIDTPKGMTMHYILIWEGRFLISAYAKPFPHKSSMRYYENFFKKFLSDTAYRKGFLLSDYKPWETTGIPDSVLWLPSIREIENLNMKEDVPFRLLAKLHWFGTDKHQDMTIKELKELVPIETYTYVENECNKAQVESTLRWIARGLKPELAVLKSQIEIEIKENRQPLS